MKIPFKYIGALQQENKILKKEVADFKSGERFKQIQRENQKLVDEYRRQIKQLNLVIEGLHKDIKTHGNGVKKHMKMHLKNYMHQ